MPEPIPGPWLEQTVATDGGGRMMEAWKLALPSWKPMLSISSETWARSSKTCGR